MSVVSHREAAVHTEAGAHRRSTALQLQALVLAAREEHANTCTQKSDAQTHGRADPQVLLDEVSAW